MILFLAWVRMLLVVLPPVVVFENVKLFPMDLLHTLLGVAYRIDEVITDPCKLGWPIRRVRIYAVLIARSHNCSWRPLAELFDNLKVDRPLPGRVLFFERHQRASSLPAGAARNLEAYRDRYGRDPSHLFDLSQHAWGRPRASLTPGPCMTLTRSSRSIFCSGEHRVLSPCELLAGQGFPDCGVDSDGNFARGPEFDGLSDAMLTSLAGNAMNAACAGPI